MTLESPFLPFSHSAKFAYLLSHLIHLIIYADLLYTHTHTTNVCAHVWYAEFPFFCSALLPTTQHPLSCIQIKFRIHKMPSSLMSSFTYQVCVCVQRKMSCRIGFVRYSIIMHEQHQWQRQHGAENRNGKINTTFLTFRMRLEWAEGRWTSIELESILWHELGRSEPL